MRVTELATKKMREVNDSYGLRLIEQGKAVPAREEPAPRAAKEKRTGKE